MTIKLTFDESIGATSVKATYYDGETLSNESVTADVVGNAAELEVSDTYANEYSWINMKLEVAGSHTDNITITSPGIDKIGDCEKFWFEYAKGGTLNISVNRDTNAYISLVENKSITVDEQKYTQVLDSNAFKDLSIGTLKVTISSETSNAWASISAKAAWTNDTYYISGGVNTTTIITKQGKPAFLESLYENGLYIETSAGTFTVSVSYSVTSGN